MTETKKVDFKLTREGLVKLEHKDTKATYEAVPESVPTWLDNGWSVVAPEKGNDTDVVVTVDEEKGTGSVTPVTTSAPKEK